MLEPDAAASSDLVEDPIATRAVGARVAGALSRDEGVLDEYAAGKKENKEFNWQYVFYE